MVNVFAVEGCLGKYPELVKIIEKEYGENTIFENGSMHKILAKGDVDNNNLSIVVFEDDFQVDAFSVYIFLKYLGAAILTSVSSLILVKPKIDEENGFEPEITSLKEISFGEVALPKNKEKKIIFSAREIKVKHNDFYEEKISQK